MLIIWGMKVDTQKDSLKDFYKVEKERKVMRANEKLGNVVKIGYLERPTKKEKVAPELPTSTVLRAISDNFSAFSSEEEELLKTIFASSMTSEIKLSGSEL